MKYRYFIFILALYALVGCNPGPNIAPGVEGLIGVYQLTAESKTFLENNKSYQLVPVSEITLRRDGTVKIVGLPDCYADGFGKGNGKFLNGSGKWEIEKTYEGYGVTITIDAGASMRPGIYHGSTILIKHKRPPFSLQLGIGDPDQDEHIVYEKTAS